MNNGRYSKKRLRKICVIQNSKEYQMTVFTKENAVLEELNASIGRYTSNIVRFLKI